MDKIILADKPLDWSSADVLNVLKKDMNVSKLGHAGTLDPRATGLLVICTGKMTKRINEFIDYDKEYDGIIRIGAVTKGYDTESEEENIKDVSHIDDDALEQARQKFLGEIEQVPPMHSAVKHQGKPLYKLARKGKEIERKPRLVTISRFHIKRLSETEILFDITCSKGTYIRSIANDLGQELGVGAYLKTLRRTRVGKFMLDEFTEKSARGIKYKVLEE
jgi:tRNA pseudouridine55 synthase